MNRNDDSIVASQLGRIPRGTWRVVARCTAGAPTVIAVAPDLGGGEPFPTTFWLTCPTLSAAVHDMESAGEHTRWAERVAREPALAAAVLAADARYRDARAEEGGGADPCSGVGTAGQRDPLAVKCLHARLAAFLAGVPDPVGEAVASRLARLTATCAEDRCLGPVQAADPSRHDGDEHGQHAPR